MQRMKKHKPAAREPSWDPSPMATLGQVSVPPVSTVLGSELPWEGVEDVGRNQTSGDGGRRAPKSSPRLSSPQEGSPHPQGGPGPSLEPASTWVHPPKPTPTLDKSQHETVCGDKPIKQV